MENESLDTSKEETKEAQQPAAPEKSGKQEDWKSPVKSLVNDLLDIAESVIVSVFVVVLVFAFILRPVTVDGKAYEKIISKAPLNAPALEPTVEDGYICFIEKLS